jgi:TonB family protein
MMYAEKWRQNVELNAAFDLLKQAKTGPYENPVVTVALRSDGTVEGVTINRSSGLAEIDNAVRRIVMLLAPYAPFPGDLAMDIDVLEIRRVWSFDSAVRLFSGGR